MTHALAYPSDFFDLCCWNCVPCRDDQYLFNDSCVACEEGWMPTEDKSSCYRLNPIYMTWDSLWAIIPVAFSSIGILLTLFTFSVFIRYNRTPVIMASGRELCYVLLFGILMCYMVTFVIISKPSTGICLLQRVGLGLCLCICYAAILTKTNRISRIFNRGIKSIKRPSYTSPKSQIVICLDYVSNCWFIQSPRYTGRDSTRCSLAYLAGIISVQLVIVSAWLVIERPHVREMYPVRHIAVLTCGVSTFSVLMSLVYNMILILLCTFYAIKTRKIPENFNEAKYIGFTMYSTCIVWLAFVPIYFGTNNDFHMQLTSLCMCVSISASASLACLFFPKVYIVLFQPYKNVRQGTQSSMAGRTGVSGMRFAAYRSGQALASITASVTHNTPSASSICKDKPAEQVNGDPCGIEVNTTVT
ncbi:unnamed protein product [Cyprideis torosa]|uniref:Uncharacterized protein n=1 Tax=Cyprideis torosa TaxID=163714 RepID=A0A7R8W164_9CRUS|nr:unnamed protein product [Cyprideis torosa]CAG0880568.1 unnamed protein product [Cyprideis torosa]